MTLIDIDVLFVSFYTFTISKMTTGTILFHRRSLLLQPNKLTLLQIFTTSTSANKVEDMEYFCKQNMLAYLFLQDAF